MPWDFGAGVAAAAGAGAGLISDSIKRERDLQGAADLEALKAKIEQDKQARIADIVRSVSRTKTVGVEDESGGHSVEQRKAEHEYARDVGDALTGKGLISDAAKFYERADRYEDRLDLRTTQAAKQKSDDEKWHAQQEQAERFHKDSMRVQMDNLNLKQQDAKDFTAAVDSYINSKAGYDSAVAQDASAEVLSRLKQEVDRDSLRLKQFKVDVGESSEFAKHMNLSATLTSLNNTIKDPMTEPADVEKAKITRRDVLARMATLTAPKGSDGGGGDVQFEMVDGKLVRAGGGKPTATATSAGGKPAVPAATATGGGTINDWSKDLSRANSTSRAALDKLADLKIRLAYLRGEGGGTAATIADVERQLKDAQAEVNRLAFQ